MYEAPSTHTLLISRSVWCKLLIWNFIKYFSYITFACILSLVIIYYIYGICWKSMLNLKTFLLYLSYCFVLHLRNMLQIFWFC